MTGGHNRAITKVQGVIIAVIIIVAAVAVGAYTLLPTGPQRIEILVGASISLTGARAGFGFENKWAYEYAVNQTNKAGGILVRDLGKKLPVRLIIYDDASDAANAVSNIRRLVASDKVDLLLGEVGSEIVSAVGPVTEELAVPYVGGLGTTEGIFEKGFKWIFSNFHRARDEVLVYYLFSDSLAPADRPKTIAIWEEASDLGRDNANWAERFARERGMQVVLREQYTKNTDFTALVLKTKQLNPEVVFSIPDPPDAIKMFKVSKEQRFSPKLFAFTRGTAAAPFGRELKSDADFAGASFPYHTSVPYSINRQVVAEYQRQTGRGPTLIGIFYASTQILFGAVEKAGTLDRAKVREVLLNTEFDTTMGKVRFESNGKLAKPEDLMNIQQWVNGKLEIVWPSSIATTKFVYPFVPWDKRS